MKKPSNLIIGAAALAAAAGVAITGASLANASTGSGSGTSSGYAAPQQGGYGQMPPGQDGQAPNGRAPDPHRAFHPGEKLLTGTTKDKVTALAKAKEPTATIERVETDAEGVYEAHMVRPDGTHVTVHVGKDFTVTSVEVDGADGRGHGGPPAGAPNGAPSGSSAPSGYGTN